MQSTTSLSGQPLINLLQLPKDKLVLDFVLHRLGNGTSPERYEIISNLLAMYRTSAGFDPLALSKGRMRRVKSGEFRKLLVEIDGELALILNSDEYRQLIAKQANFEPLFHAYTSLSESLAVYPAASMVQEVEHFEEVLKRHEASELLLSFYRQHARFFEEVNKGEDLLSVIKKFDLLTERSKQLSRQTRAEFLLASFEYFFFKGKFDYRHHEELIEELAILLTAEANRYTQYELLIKIIRASILSPAPALHLATYLRYISENTSEITRLNVRCVPLLLSTLAMYDRESSIGQRNNWLNEADQHSKEHSREDERAGYKIIKAAIACETSNWDMALRALNEAEHLIHKVPGKNQFAKNIWIKLCEWRTLLLALNTINKKEVVQMDELRLHLNIAEELSKSREDNSLISMQLKLISSFLGCDWETALDLADRIIIYRKDHLNHPWKMIAGAFSAILTNTTKKAKKKVFVEALKSLDEPFYSTTVVELLLGAPQYFEEHNREKINTD